VQMDRELHRLAIAPVSQEHVAHRLHFNKLEDLLAAIGRGEVTQRQLAHAIQQETPARIEEATAQPVYRHVASRASGTGILVEGVGNLQTKMARCCNPVPPDPIVGYVTRERGITIHRRSCTFMQRLPEDRRDRLLDAQWGSSKGAAFGVEIEVEAYDRQGLLRDIGDLFAREKVNVIRVDSLSKHNHARMRFSVEISNLEQLERLLVFARQVPDVIAARRV
jgi:GTP pyrophosphokinase